MVSGRKGRKLGFKRPVDQGTTPCGVGICCPLFLLTTALLEEVPLPGHLPPCWPESRGGGISHAREAVPVVQDRAE